MVSSFEVADVVELWVWGSGQPMTLSQLEGHIETTIPEESIDSGGDDDPFELLAQQVFDEILQRQITLNTAYPFGCDGYQIKYNQENGAASPYVFCLLLSHLPADHIGSAQRAPQFEVLAMNAAIAFFGGVGLRIGWPWEKNTYNELLLDVANLLPDLGNITLPSPVTSGDRGWDILVVKGFGDNLFPKLVALGNCATGKSNWKMKGSEIEPEYFWECFQHQRPGAWMTFTAVPFRMDDDSRRRKASKSNLTFDRHRICEFGGRLTGDAEQWVAEQYQNAVDIPLDSSV